MAVAPSDVINIAPEFGATSSIQSSEIQAAIDDALLELSAEAWGTKLDLATKWLAAHKLARSHPELSQFSPRVWETPGSSDAGDLGSTRFGLEYFRLQKQLWRPIVSGGGTAWDIPRC